MTFFQLWVSISLLIISIPFIQFSWHTLAELVKGIAEDRFDLFDLLLFVVVTAATSVALTIALLLLGVL